MAEQKPDLLLSADLMHGGMLLFPSVLRVLEKVEVPPAEFYILWYVFAYGRQLHGKVIVPRDDLIYDVAQRLGMTTKKTLILVHQLIETKCLGVHRISSAEKEAVFSDSSGRKTMISLEARGAEKVTTLQQDVSRLLEALVESRPQKIRIALKAAIKILGMAIRSGKQVPRIENL